ncbi:hypothetical protein BGW42_000427 [Actinomortierella wolfii]|nr:hypothetical protein BGW42_000427 [Actinomortierella wolfii]
MVLTDIHADVGMPVCKVIEDGRLPNLTSLMLGSGHYNPGLHRAVLEALPPHQIKNLHLQDIDADDIQLLVRRQHQSLEDMHLDLNYHTLANSPPDHHIGQYASILDILSSCARLRELTIEPGGNRVVDIRHLIAKPWVCTKMEALEIPLALSRSAINNVLSQLSDDEKKEAAIRQIAQDNDHNQPLEEEGEEGGQDVGEVDVQEQRQEWEQCEVVFMKRLGELHKLRELNLQGIYNPLAGVAPSFESMTWTLANGLGYLKNLKSLEYLDLGTGPYYQGVQEFEWMKQHWPNLRDFHFSYTESVEVFDWIHKHWPELRFEETKPNIEDWYDEE